MAADRQAVIDKYCGIARLPDALFAFTFPLRRQAVEKLALRPGQSVLEVGCSSGANFRYLQAAAGPSGRVVGLDLSPDMVAAARDRVARAGWSNVQVVEGAAEDAAVGGPFDALLLFAMHDVLTSPAGLDHCLAALKSGARVVSAGPWVPEHGPARLMRPVLRQVFRRFALSTQDTGQPWRLLAERVPGLQMKTHGPMYVAWGTIGQLPP